MLNYQLRYGSHYYDNPVTLEMSSFSEGDQMRLALYDDEHSFFVDLTRNIPAVEIKPFCGFVDNFLNPENVDFIKNNNLGEKIGTLSYNGKEYLIFEFYPERLKELAGETFDNYVPVTEETKKNLIDEMKKLGFEYKPDKKSKTVNFSHPFLNDVAHFFSWYDVHKFISESQKSSEKTAIKQKSKNTMSIGF